MSVNSIVEIYLRDLKRIVTNWAALLIIIGLIILPSMYAWFNIKSSWNPYGNTKGLKIAIINEDHGANVLSSKINIGNEVVQSLKETPTLGWVFKNRNEAHEGVKQGKYYASILIPSDFSRKISTVLTDNPQKPELVYQVNEKLNIIAPKYTEKGASGIASEITKKFEKTVSKEVLTEFNKIGIDLQANLPLLKKVEKTILLLDKDLPEIEKGVKNALNDFDKIQGVIQTAKKDLVRINELASSGSKLATNMNSFLTKLDQSIQNSIPFIKQSFLLLQHQASTIENILTQLQDPNINKSDAIDMVNELEGQLPSSIKSLSSLQQLLQSFHNLDTNVTLNNEINSLNSIQTNLIDLQSLTDEIKHDLEIGKEIPADILQKMLSISKTVNNRLTLINDQFDTRYIPKLNEVSKLATTSMKNIMTVLDDTKKSIPTINGVLLNTSNLLTLKKGEIEQLINDLPIIKNKISRLAYEIRKAKEKGSLEDLINFLRTDIEKVSDFYSNPIEIKKERLFPIPNYGTGMTPFYTTLSLWVGALLLVSLLTTEVHENKQYRSSEIYFGRFLTFVTISILQSLVVTSGNFLILGTYAANKGYFILFGILISIVFTFIVYTLVSVFGNVGKGMSIIFLVLQISGAGGVYPVQVTPLFFQKINPYLPFTYAISLLREATGGILWSTVRKDIMILLAFMILSILLGIVLKGPINKKAKIIMDLSKKSKLIH